MYWVFTFFGDIQYFNKWMCKPMHSAHICGAQYMPRSPWAHRALEHQSPVSFVPISCDLPPDSSPRPPSLSILRTCKVMHNELSKCFGTEPTVRPNSSSIGASRRHLRLVVVDKFITLQRLYYVLSTRRPRNVLSTCAGLAGAGGLWAEIARATVPGLCEKRQSWGVRARGYWIMSGCESEKRSSRTKVHDTRVHLKWIYKMMRAKNK